MRLRTVILILALCAVPALAGWARWFGVSRPTATTVPMDPYESDMLMLWGFDNVPPTNAQHKVFDDSGNGLIGTPSSTPFSYPIIGTNADGTVNRGLNTLAYALRCIETNTFASVVQPNETSEYTMAYWVKGVGTTAGWSGNYYWYDTINNQKFMQSRSGSYRDFSSYKTNVLDANYSVSLTSTGSWDLLTITFRTNRFCAYTNGLLLHTDTSVSTGPTGVLSYIQVSSSSLGATLDRIVLYRRILTSQEVMNVWTYTHPTNRIWRK